MGRAVVLQARIDDPFLSYPFEKMLVLFFGNATEEEDFFGFDPESQSVDPLAFMGLTREECNTSLHEQFGYLPSAFELDRLRSRESGGGRLFLSRLQLSLTTNTKENTSHDIHH